jgi:hypothetical protein
VRLGSGSGCSGGGEVGSISVTVFGARVRGVEHLDPIPVQGMILCLI